MKFFYDTEFHEYHRTPWFGKKHHVIDLISIGIVSDDGRKFYAVCKDFDIDAAWNSSDGHKCIRHSPGCLKYVGCPACRPTYWLRENVLKPLHAELAAMNENLMHEGESWFTLNNLKKLVTKYGKTREEIAKEILQFVWNPYPPYSPEHPSPIPTNTPFDLYGYYSAYDHVVLCSLFGKMIDLPKGFPMYTRDLKQMIDEFITAATWPSLRHLPFEQALKIVKMHEDYPKNPSEHNALADAQWNKDLYDFLQKL